MPCVHVPALPLTQPSAPARARAFQMFMLHLRSTDRANVQQLSIAPLAVRGAMPSALAALPDSCPDKESDPILAS